MRPYLWGGGLLNNIKYYSSPFLLLHAFISIISIFIICAIIDLIRQATVEKIFIKFVDKYFEPLKKVCIRVYNKILIVLEKCIF